MNLNFNIINQEVFLSFIPLEFNSVEILLKDNPIKKIENINIGLFTKDEEYIDVDNYKLYFPSIKYMSDISDFFYSMTDEQYNIYKLDIVFENFTMLYDDDSLFTIGGKINSLRDYVFFHNMYIKIYDIYMKSGHELDEWDLD